MCLYLLANEGHLEVIEEEDEDVIVDELKQYYDHFYTEEEQKVTLRAKEGDPLRGCAERYAQKQLFLEMLSSKEQAGKWKEVSVSKKRQEKKEKKKEKKRKGKGMKP
jgi:hypothetical protein